jgi:hypothetical protein
MLIKLKVIPGAKKNEIVEHAGSFMRVKISAQPEKGKANRELIKFLAEYLKVPKLAIEIKSGLTQREKFLEVQE